MARAQRDRQSSKRRRPDEVDEEIESSDSEEFGSGAEKDSSDDEGPNAAGVQGGTSALSADEKRLLLAREYLEKMGLSYGQDDIEDVSNSMRKIGGGGKKFSPLEVSDHLRSGDVVVRPLTKHLANCLDVAPGDDYVYTGGKDGRVIQWNVETGTRVVCKSDSTEPIQAVSLAMNGRLLLSAGEGPDICMWDTRLLSKSCISKFSRQHTSRITCMSVQANQFCTGSDDKTLRVWSLLNKKCENVNYGHTANLICLDALDTANAVTGGQDGTVRYWHLNENSHAMYHDPESGGGGFIDSVALVGRRYGFLSGHETGHIKLWSISKRKVFKSARIEGEGWVSSMACIPNADVAFTGSSTGHIEGWKLGLFPEPVLERISKFPVEGHVNGMHISPSGAFLFAATSREERLGRWKIVKSPNVGLAIIPLEHKYIDELYPDNDDQ